LGNGELASLAYGSLKELHKIEELYQREELILGGDPWSIWGISSGFFDSVFVLVFALVFTAPFRSAIAPEIACFIGFFGNWPRF
jgi:hypothetical protein